MSAADLDVVEPVAAEPSRLHAAVVIADYGLVRAAPDTRDEAVARLILHHHVPWRQAELIARRAVAIAPPRERDEVRILADRLGIDL